MRGITLRAEPRRHDRHQPPTGCQALGSRDEMLGGDVFVPGAIDRGGEGRVHDDHVGQNLDLQQIVDMLAIMACHLAAENRAQETLAKGINLIEQKLGTGPGGESGEGTRASRGLQHGLALADRCGTHGQGREWQRRGKLLQPDLLLRPACFRQEP